MLPADPVGLAPLTAASAGPAAATMSMPGDSPEEYFRERGFDVPVDERELHAEYMAAGELGRASFFLPGRCYFCVNLLRSGSVIATGYAHGETRDDALDELGRASPASRISASFRGDGPAVSARARVIEAVVDRAW